MGGCRGCAARAARARGAGGGSARRGGSFAGRQSVGKKKKGNSLRHARARGCAVGTREEAQVCRDAPPRASRARQVTRELHLGAPALARPPRLRGRAQGVGRSPARRAVAPAPLFFYAPLHRMAPKTLCANRWPPRARYGGCARATAPVRPADTQPIASMPISRMIPTPPPRCGFPCACTGRRCGQQLQRPRGARAGARARGPQRSAAGVLRGGEGGTCAATRAERRHARRRERARPPVRYEGRGG